MKKKIKEGTLSPEEQIAIIQESCAQLEWVIAMNDSEEGVKGLIIGNFDFVRETVEQLDDLHDYEVWGKPSQGNGEIH